MTLRDLLPAEAARAAALSDDGAVSRWTAEDYGRVARGEFSERFCLVAEEPPGSLGGLLLASLLPVPSGGGTAEILNLVVVSTLRRRGIGTALMEEALRRMLHAGAARVWLEVRASNLPALALYRRMGFRETGRRLQYYQNPAEDALLLESPLPLC